MKALALVCFAGAFGIGLVGLFARREYAGAPMARLVAGSITMLAGALLLGLVLGCP